MSEFYRGVKVPTSNSEWLQYEGRQWFDAVAERGLKRENLPIEERILVDAAEAHSRSVMLSPAIER